MSDFVVEGNLPGNLPPEMWLKVSEYLDPIGDYAHLLLASKAFAKLVRQWFLPKLSAIGGCDYVLHSPRRVDVLLSQLLLGPSKLRCVSLRGSWARLRPLVDGLRDAALPTLVALHVAVQTPDDASADAEPCPDRLNIEEHLEGLVLAYAAQLKALTMFVEVLYESGDMMDLWVSFPRLWAAVVQCSLLTDLGLSLVPTPNFFAFMAPNFPHLVNFAYCSLVSDLAGSHLLIEAVFRAGNSDLKSVLWCASFDGSNSLDPSMMFERLSDGTFKVSYLGNHMSAARFLFTPIRKLIRSFPNLAILHIWDAEFDIQPAIRQFFETHEKAPDPQRLQILGHVTKGAPLSIRSYPEKVTPALYARCVVKMAEDPTAALNDPLHSHYCRFTSGQSVVDVHAFTPTWIEAAAAERRSPDRLRSCSLSSSLGLLPFYLHAKTQAQQRRNQDEDADYYPSKTLFELTRS